MFYREIDLIELSNTLGLFLTEAVKAIRPKGSEPLSAMERVWKSIHFMEQNIHRNCNLKEFATAANLSERHYNRKFLSVTGVSPIHYFQQMKINEALHKLRYTDLPVDRIAQSLGYTDPLYFSRIFKKLQGMPPSQCRK